MMMMMINFRSSGRFSMSFSQHFTISVNNRFIFSRVRWKENVRYHWFSFFIVSFGRWSRNGRIIFEYNDRLSSFTFLCSRSRTSRSLSMAIRREFSSIWFDKRIEGETFINVKIFLLQVRNNYLPVIIKHVNLSTIDQLHLKKIHVRGLEVCWVILKRRRHFSKRNLRRLISLIIFPC